MESCTGSLTFTCKRALSLRAPRAWSPARACAPFRTRRRRCCAPEWDRRGISGRAPSWGPALPAPRRSPAACTPGSRCQLCGSPGLPIRALLVAGGEGEAAHRALCGIARVAALHPCRVCGHGADLPLDRFRVLAERDRIVVGLGHLLAVDAGKLRGLGEQRLGLDQNQAPASFEVAEQALAVGDREVALLFQ